jgi:hypothetical protein
METRTKWVEIIISLGLAALACSVPTSRNLVDPVNEDQSAVVATERALQMTQTALAVQVSQAQQGDGIDSQPEEILPTDTVATTSQVGVEGALLAYNMAAAGQLTAAVVDAALEGGYQYPHPRHVEFTLVGGQGVISLVPIHRYALVYDKAEQTIAELLVALVTPQSVGTDCIPELPLREFFNQCSHQEFITSLKNINFKNGSGIRFVTVYAIQDYAPVDNASLRYNFQGLSHDGDCYVSIEFKLAHSSLPASGELPIEVYTDMSGEEGDRYFGMVAQQLSQDEAGYSPALARIDELIESLEVIQCGVNE